MSYATDRLIKNARNALPGSLDNVILLELFNVLDTFFRDSSIWIEDIPFSVATADPAGTIYYIEPESVSVIVRLFNVVSSTGFRQRGAAMQLPGEVTLTSPPSQSDTYTATVALSIIDPVQRDGYPEFPEWILDKYGVGILDGVIGRMMAQPAKPYTNVQLALAHMTAFRKTVSIAGTESVHKNVHNAQAWVYPQQFSTRGQRR
jgi:hypothetical protein